MILAWEIYELPPPNKATLWDKLTHAYTPSERKYPHKTRKVKARRDRKRKRGKR